MAEKRIILELGAGADLHGRDYTKAAKRAVEDAMRHSSLSIFRSLDLQAATMRVEITIGVQEPDKVDPAAVAAVSGRFLPARAALSACVAPFDVAAAARPGQITKARAGGARCAAMRPAVDPPPCAGGAGGAGRRRGAGGAACGRGQPRAPQNMSWIMVTICSTRWSAMR